MVYVRDLVDKPRPRVFLFCPSCLSMDTAERGAYAHLDPDTKLRCGDHLPMTDFELVEVRRIHPRSAESW